MKSERAVDRRVIEDCQRGDREAFRILFEAYQDRAYAIAYHFCGDPVNARDITQQVFLKLFTCIDQFRFNSEFSTWLYRLVANVCLDEHRRRRRFLPWTDLDEGKERRSMEEHLDRRETQGEVRAAILQLKPKLRLVILLKYFEGLSYEEMAQVLGCSSGTVASRLNRGHQMLARKLGHLRGALPINEEGSC
jgi:RNA polymerase sigma-70 factor (ECF subfamily)